MLVKAEVVMDEHWNCVPNLCMVAYKILETTTRKLDMFSLTDGLKPI